MLHIRYEYFESQISIPNKNFEYKVPKFIYDLFFFAFWVTFAFSGAISAGHFIGWKHLSSAWEFNATISIIVLFILAFIKIQFPIVLAVLLAVDTIVWSTFYVIPLFNAVISLFNSTEITAFTSETFDVKIFFGVLCIIFGLFLYILFTTTLPLFLYSVCRYVLDFKSQKFLRTVCREIKHFCDSSKYNDTIRREIIDDILRNECIYKVVRNADYSFPKSVYIYIAAHAKRIAHADYRHNEEEKSYPSGVIRGNMKINIYSFTVKAHIQSISYTNVAEGYTMKTILTV